MTKSTITREPITHYLKIYPEFFSAVCTGVKRAELRKNDRDYRVGDTLHLMETPRGSCDSTGEFINAAITHIADVGEWMPGYVLLSIEREAMDRKAAMDSEPVAWLLSGGGAKNVVCFDSGNAYADPLREVTPLYRHAQPVPVAQPVMFIDGDISSDDADKLAKVIREFNEEDERPLAKMARIIRENPHPKNECDMPKSQSAQVVSEDLYKLANHIASSKNGLTDEWQDWAEELESDIRRAATLNQK